jgi:hypothetical protein
VSGDTCPREFSSAPGSCARGRCCKRNPSPPTSPPRPTLPPRPTSPPRPMMCQGQCTGGSRCMGSARPAPGICRPGQTCCSRGGGFGGRDLSENVEAACNSTVTVTNSSDDSVDDESDMDRDLTD